MASTPLATQLSEVRRAKGIELEDLRQRAGLKCSADSLSRKLRGKQPMAMTEAERIAQALDHEFVLVWKTGAAGRAA